MPAIKMVLSSQTSQVKWSRAAVEAEHIRIRLPFGSWLSVLFMYRLVRPRGAAPGPAGGLQVNLYGL